MGTNPWTQMPWMLFDTETTGVDPHHDRVVSAATINVRTTPGHAPDTVTWLINPGIPIPAAATNVHGITTEHATTHGQDPAAALLEIATRILAANRIGLPIVGHNVAYDLSLLHAELRRHGHTGPADELARIHGVIDTLVLDRYLDPWRRKTVASRRLTDLSRHLGVPLDEADAHGAQADALASGRVLWALARKFPSITDMSLSALHRFQVEQARTQGDSLGAWLVKQGRADDATRDWPVIPLPTTWDPTHTPNPEHQETAA